MMMSDRFLVMLRCLLTSECSLYIVVFFLGIFLGISEIAKNGLGHFYAQEFGPAVMLACGHDFVVPAFNNTPEGVRARAALSSFLHSKTGSLNCASLDASVLSPGPPLNALHKSMRYVMYGVGGVWSVRGVSWSSLAVLFGLLCGIVTCATYGIARLSTGRVVSLAAVFLLATSAWNLDYLPHLRDYAKAPFLLSGIALLGSLIVRDARFSVKVFTALAYGVVAGLGLGFRTDVILLLPIFAVSAIFFLPWHEPSMWRDRGIILFAATIAFILTSLPVTLFYAQGGSNFWHFILLGLTQPFNIPLAIEAQTYFLGDAYNDGLIVRLVNVFLSSRAEYLPVDLAMAAYDQAGRDLYFTYFSHFPADIIVRAYASVIKILSMSHWLPASLGIAGVLVAVTMIALHNVRLALFAVLVIVYFGGVSSLQFDGRHYQYLEFVPVLALAFIIHTGCVETGARLAASLGWQERRTTRESCIRVQRLVSAGLFWGILIGLGVAALAGARFYQQGAARDFFSTLSTVPVDAVTIEQKADADGSILFRPVGSAFDTAGQVVKFPLYDTPDNPGWLHFYFVAEIGGPECEQPFGELVFQYTAPTQFDDRTYRVSVRNLPGETSRVFFPVSYSPAHYRRDQFSGVALHGFDSSCFLGLSTLHGFDPGWLPLTIVLDQRWQSDSLYQRMQVELAVGEFFRRLSDPVTNVYASEVRTGRDESVAIHLPLKGADMIVLRADDGGNGISSDHANWIEPRLVNTSGSLPMHSLSPLFAQQGWGELRINTSVTGKPLTIGTQTFRYGLGTHANSTIVFRVPEGFDTTEATFEALVGVDGVTNGAGAVRFYVDINGQ